MNNLETIRHSTAHLLAHAVKLLFPTAKLAIGPAIDDGFYYDFAYERPFTLEDFAAIEKKMHELAELNFPIVREVVTYEEAEKFLTKCGETYKLKLLAEIPKGDEITFYRQDDFSDLCRGPHVEATGQLQAFKLTKLAGAYWQGDSKNEMLQRIYGTAWATQAELDEYLRFLDEAEKRDHRKLGKLMDLFHLQEEAPGMVFWHGDGHIIYRTVIAYMRNLLQTTGYQEVSAPIILDKSLWEKSGHWDKFGTKNMFITESENRMMAIKPMNCIGHIQIFNQHLHSYRDLPVRYGEFGICHRNEASGTLHGLMRLRQFTQDDAHVFCTEDQLLDEINKMIDLIFQTYKDFGFDDVIVRLATRPEKFIGTERNWHLAEQALERALSGKKILWELLPGEGAFYGPKLEFNLRDSLKRVWQCGTVQVDFAMPERFGVEYVGSNSARFTPIMLHRAILGSIERFIGILLEHYAGLLPLWLAPCQAVILNITKDQIDYASEIQNLMNNLGLRVKLDLRNEKIGFKIREHTIARIPYLLVIGNREMEKRQVAVRTHDGKDLGSLAVDEFIAKLGNESLPPKSC